MHPGHAQTRHHLAQRSPVVEPTLTGRPPPSDVERSDDALGAHLCDGLREQVWLPDGRGSHDHPVGAGRNRLGGIGWRANAAADLERHTGVGQGRPQLLRSRPVSRPGQVHHVHQRRPGIVETPRLRDWILRIHGHALEIPFDEPHDLPVEHIDRRNQLHCPSPRRW